MHYYYFLFIFLMQTGTIKFFNEEKGYGFITDDATGQDIFVHATGLRTERVNQGDKVRYEEQEGKKGKVAAEVVVIED